MADDRAPLHAYLDKLIDQDPAVLQNKDASTAELFDRVTSFAAEDEPLLQDRSRRQILLPIKYSEIWKFYKMAVASFWTVEELILTGDDKDWVKLTAGERHFVTNILAFFAASDFIVNENIMERFTKDVQIPEATFFYDFQTTMENIHSETYALLLETYVKDAKERERCLNAVSTIPCIQKKAAWAQKWIHSRDASFATRLVCFCAVEGIHFSGSFCAIYWIKKRGLLPGLTFSNELISRDEALHTDFGCLIYSMLQNKLSEEEVHAIIRDAVDIEKEFITESLPCRLIGMNAELMKTYIEVVANRLAVQLGYAKIWKNSKNPFDFMEMQSLERRSNFFEGRVSQYQKAFVGNEASDSATDFDFNADF